MLFQNQHLSFKYFVIHLSYWPVYKQKVIKSKLISIVVCHIIYDDKLKKKQIFPYVKNTKKEQEHLFVQTIISHRQGANWTGGFDHKKNIPLHY